MERNGQVPSEGEVVSGLLELAAALDRIAPLVAAVEHAAHHNAVCEAGIANCSRCDKLDARRLDVERELVAAITAWNRRAVSSELQETLTRWDATRKEWPTLENCRAWAMGVGDLLEAGDALRSLLARGEQSGTSAEAQPAIPSAATRDLTHGQPEPTPANSPARSLLDKKGEG